MSRKKIKHNNIKLFSIVIPALSKKYSDKKIRDIAIESHIEKLRIDFERIPSIVSRVP